MWGDFERRLRRLEIAAARSKIIEVWVEQDDGLLRSHSGECMTREAFDQLYPPGSSGIIVIGEMDAKL
jgi:hypothetical protein